MKQAGRYWVPDAETQQIDELAAGGWQLSHLREALRHVPPERNARAVDGGAHVGSWTLRMAKRFSEVIAFEPADDAFECLFLNTEHARGIKRFRCALGAEAGSAGMADDTKYDGGNTGGRFLSGDGDIPVIPLDEMHLDALDFLKLDVEGYEFHAIQGARATIMTHHPVVMIEEKHRMAFRHGLEPGAARALLIELGMIEVGGIGADRIFGWPK
jgi:FkbM family methyltransferase